MPKMNKSRKTMTLKWLGFLSILWHSFRSCDRQRFEKYDEIVEAHAVIRFV